MKSILFGASAGLGRALAAELARAGHELFLVASDARDVAATVADLRLRHGVAAAGLALDLRDFDAAALRRRCREAIGPPENVFYVAGASLRERDPQDLSDADIESLVAVNLTGGIKAVNAFLPDLCASPRANCVGIGSAAQARARRRNTVYAAAKSGLEFYFQGVARRLAASGGKVQFYRVGHLDTAMSFGRASWLPKTATADAAARIRAGLGKSIEAAYLPGWWHYVAAACALMPAGWLEGMERTLEGPSCAIR